MILGLSLLGLARAANRPGSVAASARTAVPLAQLKAVAEENPSPQNLELLTRRYVEQGDAVAALTVAQRFVERFPSDPIARNALGIAYAQNGRAKDARQEFARAISLNPRAVDPYCNLGQLAERMGDHASARAEFDLATSVDPNSARAWRGVGEATAALQDQAPTAAFERALKLAPDDGATHAALGSYLSEVGRGAEAREHLERALRLGYGSASLFASLAMSYADEPEGPDQLARALDFAHRAEAMGEDSAFVFYAEGVALQHLHRYRDAILAYQKVIVRSADSNGAWMGISQCCRALGQRKQANEAAQVAERVLTERQRASSLRHQISLYPNRLDLREQWAAVMMRNGHYLLAADQYRYVAQHSPQEPGRWAKVAEAFERGGKPELARGVRKFMRSQMPARGVDQLAGSLSRPVASR